MNLGKLRKMSSTILLDYYLQVSLRNGRYLQKRDFKQLIINRNSLKHALKSSNNRSLSDISEDNRLVKQSSVPNLEAVPTSLRFLFINEETGEEITTYPSFTSISSLVRNMNSLNVNVDTFEDKLNSALNISSNHLSKQHLKNWNQFCDQINYKKVIAIDDFKQLINGYLDLETVDNRRDASDILHYLLMTWRLGYVIEKLLQNPNDYQNEISILERLCKQHVSHSNSYTILYFYWVNLLSEGTLYSTRKASRMAKRYPEILSYFLSDIKNYIDEMDINQVDSLQLPKCFDVAQLLQKNHLLFLEIISNCDVDPMEFETNVALILWDEDMSDRTFFLLSKCFESFSRDTSIHRYSHRYHTHHKYSHKPLQTDMLSDSRVEDLVLCFSEVVRDVVEENNEKWHGRIQDLLNKLNLNYPIFHYIYYLYLNESDAEGNKSRKNLLLQENRVILDLENTSLRVEELVGIDGKQKRKHISEFLNEVDYLSQGECTSNIKGKSDITEDSKSSIDSNSDRRKEIESEFQFLKLIDTSNYEGAINMLAEGALPSPIALDRLIKDAVNTSDKNLLKELRSVLPVKSQMSDYLYVEENTLWMIEIDELWNKDKRNDALYRSLLRYEVLLEDEYSIQSVAFHKIKKNIRSYIREYAWSLLKDRKFEVGHISNLNELKSFGVKLGDTYQDFSILAMYLESLYFSDQPLIRSKAEEMIYQYPSLPRSLDIDAVLDRATNVQNDKLFFIILQFCLRFDFDDFIKSRVIEKWIIYHCDKGSDEGLRKANELMIKSKELKIPVTPDALQYYSDLNYNLSGLSANIMRLFKFKL